MLQLYPGIFSSKLPVNSLLFFIARSCPWKDLFLMCLETWDSSAPKTLPSEYGKLAFCYVQPWAMLWGIVYLEPICNPRGFFRYECLIQGAYAMGVIHNKNNLLCLRIFFVNKLPYLLRSTSASSSMRSDTARSTRIRQGSSSSWWTGSRPGEAEAWYSPALHILSLWLSECLCRPCPIAAVLFSVWERSCYPIVVVLALYLVLVSLSVWHRRLHTPERLITCKESIIIHCLAA